MCSTSITFLFYQRAVIYWKSDKNKYLDSCSRTDNGTCLSDKQKPDKDKQAGLYYYKDSADTLKERTKEDDVFLLVPK